MVFLLLFVMALAFWLIIYRWIQIKVNFSEQKKFLTLDKLSIVNKIQVNGFHSVDHIYVLNLAKNSVKKIRMAEEVKNKLGITLKGDNFFSAFYGKTVANTVTSLIKEGIISSHYRYSFFKKNLYIDRLKNPGQLGHYISFYQIFTNALANNLKFFLILEDDAVLSPFLHKHIASLVNFLEQTDYAYISLGQAKFFYQQNKKYIHTSEPVCSFGAFNLYPVEQSQGLFRQTHGMLFKTSRLESLVGKYFPMEWPTDVALGYWSRGIFSNNKQEGTTNVKVPGIFCFPPLAEQSYDHSSDIDHWTDIDFKKIIRAKSLKGIQ